MKHKKWVFFLLLLCFLLPVTTQAAEEQDIEIGIGFKEAQPLPKEIPATPKENVLPLTSGDRIYQARRIRALPKTGMIQTSWINVIGIFCLAVWFWLFLFFRIREDNDSQEGGNRNETK